MTVASLEGGFKDPAIQSAHAFRGIMDAMARPGTIQNISGATPPAPMSRAAGAVVLTLCDPDTPVFLAGAYATDEVRAWIAFHTGAPVAPQAECMFAMGTWEDLAPLSSYPIGTPEYPDRSATLIVECSELANSGPCLRGPGIQTTTQLSLPDTVPFIDNARLFPLGLDFIFTSGDSLAALPRTTEVS